MRSLRLVVLASLVLLSFARLASGQSAPGVIRDDLRKFTIDIPSGWKLDRELLEMQNNIIKERIADPDFVYVAAFVPEGGITETSPYVIIQYSPGDYKLKTWETVEAALQASSTQDTVDKDTASVRDLVGKVAVGTPIIDRASKRFYLRLSGDGKESTRAFEAMIIGTFANHGLIQANSYALEGSNVDPVANANAFIDAVTLDEGTAFTPIAIAQAPLALSAKPAPATEQKTIWGEVSKKVGHWLLRGVIIAVIVVGVSLLWAWISVKRGK
jgi:hypothetical protein